MDKAKDGQRSNGKILLNNDDSGKMSYRKGKIVRTIFTLECALLTLEYALPIMFTLKCALVAKVISDTQL